MLQFEEYIHKLLEARHNPKDKKKVRASPERQLTQGQAHDEHELAYLLSFASEQHKLGKDVNIGFLLHEINKARNKPGHALSYDKAPDENFIKGIRIKGISEESHYNMLELCAYAVAESLKHPVFEQLLEDGFSAKVIGGKRGELSDCWLNQGNKPGSSTASSKTDLRITNNTTGESTILAVTVKRGPAQGASAQPNEGLAIMKCTAQIVMKKSGMSDRDQKKVTRLLDEMEAIWKSTYDRNYNSKETRDRAINKLKQPLLDIQNKLSKILGPKWHKAVIREAMFAELKFRPGDDYHRRQ